MDVDDVITTGASRVIPAGVVSLHQLSCGILGVVIKADDVGLMTLGASQLGSAESEG